MLLIDLGLVNKKSHQISNKEALRWTLIWIGLSMGFSALVWWQMGFAKFAEYQSAYWIEEALSVDNMFVFILVFKFNLDLNKITLDTFFIKHLKGSN